MSPTDAELDVPESSSESAEQGRIRSGKLAGLTMWAAIWTVAWPVLIESFCQALVGMVDTTLAAGISEAATDGIGAASYFGWIVGLLGIAIGVGATALVSRAMGKGRTALAGAVVGQSVTLSLAGGLVVGLLIVLLAPTVAGWFNLTPEATRDAVTYLRITAIGVPATTLLAAGISCCRGAGDSVVPLTVMVVVNIVNLLASVALSGVDIAHSRLLPDGTVHRAVLFANPIELNWGIAGIAWGTVIGWTIGALLVVIALSRGVHGLRLRAQRLRPHWHTMRRLTKIGVPNLLETFGMWFGNFLTILLVGWMNNPGMLGAHIVAVRIEASSYLPGFAMAAAAATLTGQYLGAASPRLARLAAIRCTLVASAIMGAFAMLFLAIPERIVGVFSQQALHLSLAPPLLMVAAFVQIPFAIAIVFRSAMRGAGDTRGVLWITWFSTWCIRLPLAWLFSGVDVPLWNGQVIPNPAPLQHWFGTHPLVGFWIGLCGELVIRAGLFAVRFFRGQWLKVRV